MAFLSKQTSEGRPRLDRRDAKKITDYDPSPSPQNSFRNKDIKSFKVVGDGVGEIERLCQELGVAGGVDAFSIPQDEWKASKAKESALDRIIMEQTMRSKSLDEAQSRLWSQHHDNDLSTSSLGSAVSLNATPFPAYSSLSSSSGDSLSSNNSLVGGLETGSGSFEHHSRVPRAHSVRTKKASIATDRSVVANHQRKVVPLQHELHRDLDNDQFYMIKEISTRNVDTEESEHHRIAYNRQRPLAEIEQMIDPPRSKIDRPILPPPARLSKAYLSRLSTHELLESFGPTEFAHDIVRQVSDDGSSSSSDSECSESEVSEVIKEEVENAKETVHEHACSEKEVQKKTDILPVEHNIQNISFRSWTKLELLGKGSFGTVYEACSEDGIYFAVKEVSLSVKDSKMQQSITQLEQEIEFLSRIQHENIVRYLGTQKEPDKLYIFLELVTKGSLSSLYQKHKLFDSQIRSYTRQILCGLKYLHERKVLHRDIKCANILVDTNGKIKLADFGLARQISQLDELQSCKGSAYWMAPEVIDPTKTYGLPADIWGVGCTVLEMATRQLPFSGLEWTKVLWKVGHGELPPIPDSLSEEAKDFIKQCLEVDALKRPTAAQLLMHPFVKYAGGTGLS
ncbi:hypothetical protein KP509_24G062200 [Ceratopteris richardii]|uniref:mitogen-activated protein kinase kinase kinase n=1 Tax=Ceratopteris richardii TaxID=49495 RepID=A0A8T2RV53_CERRI|nr:hypothetical protein KP509_24G062200 [Ceratopteris richardii]